jgi:lysosomal alpha-mannosidase
MIAKPHTKFTYAEMKFFSMWYTRLSPALKSKVKSLIAEGRLELINGGWSENDEACPIYEDIIDNMMVGH